MTPNFPSYRQVIDYDCAVLFFRQNYFHNIAMQASQLTHLRVDGKEKMLKKDDLSQKNSDQISSGQEYLLLSQIEVESYSEPSEGKSRSRSFDEKKLPNTASSDFNECQNIAVSCFKEKLYETLSKNFKFEKVIEEMYEIFCSTILGINQILEILEIPHKSISSFNELKYQEEKNDSELTEISTYFSDSLNRIASQVSRYRPISEIQIYKRKIQNLERKNSSLLEYMEKRKQYTQALKSKISELKEKKKQVEEENEKINITLLQIRKQNERMKEEIEEKVFQGIFQKQEGWQIEQKINPKLMNRTELARILRRLLRRIKNHERYCEGVIKLTSKEILSMKEESSPKKSRRKGLHLEDLDN